ncbi:hypothetical protein DFH08DRAFT_817165 [Mycena albidolilacea]|uniref:Uncharacterized protein n=1 Tax=Mycena albidolilacea TaxID=1033008 RepID=A0AAD6ZIW2_9AGAR|nr:hypothetical protein DFH08DRAFT_817165 [Mycena albidolilacea]
MWIRYKNTERTLITDPDVALWDQSWDKADLIPVQAVVLLWVAVLSHPKLLRHKDQGSRINLNCNEKVMHTTGAMVCTVPNVFAIAVMRKFTIFWLSREKISDQCTRSWMPPQTNGDHSDLWYHLGKLLNTRQKVRKWVPDPGKTQSAIEPKASSMDRREKIREQTLKGLGKAKNEKSNIMERKRNRRKTGTGGTPQGTSKGSENVPEVGEHQQNPKASRMEKAVRKSEIKRIWPSCCTHHKGWRKETGCFGR